MQQQELAERARPRKPQVDLAMGKYLKLYRKARKGTQAKASTRKKKILGLDKHSRRNFSNNQLKRMLRRDNRQINIQEKIYKLASYLETNKLLDEKKKISQLKKMRKQNKRRQDVRLEKRYRRKVKNIRNDL
ncbi:MAG: hypothetical protein HRT73_10000 [Flavobacteriales bacterium]|nr:hypothetical protein [Flavobacteriales bacterium]